MNLIPVTVCGKIWHQSFPPFTVFGLKDTIVDQRCRKLPQRRIHLRSYSRRVLKHVTFSEKRTSDAAEANLSFPFQG